MADAIQEGDVVLLNKRPYKSGEVCAVRVDRSDATLKYLDLYVNPEMVLLRPHNPAYPSVEVEAERVIVDGVFSGLLRGEVIGDLMQGDEMN
jgi:repressor LexA